MMTTSVFGSGGGPRVVGGGGCHHDGGTIMIRGGRRIQQKQYQYQQYQCCFGGGICRRGILSSAIENHILIIKERHDKILERLQQQQQESPPDTNDSSWSTSSTTSLGDLGKELSSLSVIVNLNNKRQEIHDEMISVQDLMIEAAAAASDGEDIEKECQLEISSLKEQYEDIEYQLIEAVVIKKPHSNKNGRNDDDDDNDDDPTNDAIIEIRAGTGGDEATLFANELLQCYIKTAKSLRWNVETLNESKSDLGGTKEAAISISGTATYYPNSTPNDSTSSRRQQQQQPLGPYGTFKFESGVHRVQRVPINADKIHTSACSVAVLPMLSNDYNSHRSGGELLPASELKIETMRASGAGGQHVNTTDSAVRIIHIPTGITASIQDERSQHKNKEKALRLISARVNDQKRIHKEQARGEIRSNLMGGGDRSERIRTYNWPQDRITDHRSKETYHGISSMLQGSSSGNTNTSGGLVTTFLPKLKSLFIEELIQQFEQQQYQDNNNKAKSSSSSSSSRK